VRNTLRHAGASHLLVTVGFRTVDLALSVADDGRGFLPEGLGEQGSGISACASGRDSRCVRPPGRARSSRQPCRSPRPDQGVAPSLPDRAAGPRFAKLVVGRAGNGTFASITRHEQPLP
jgi:hypothetical protein